MMLDLNDERWSDLRGGYHIPFDPRPLIKKIESGTDLKINWHELWGELHHQGNVGEASYAAVPHIVRIQRQRGIPDWNPYALVACIELARAQGNNPELPTWLEKEYFDSIQELAKIGMEEFSQAKASAEIRGILTILALSKGARTYAKLILEYSEEELVALEVIDLVS
jgi:hypothetical protein